MRIRRSATFGGVWPFAQARRAGRKCSGQRASQRSRPSRRDMPRPDPPEGATLVPAIHGAPAVLVSLLAAQEMEFPGPLPQRLLDRVRGHEHARALERESGVETGSVEV